MTTASRSRHAIGRHVPTTSVRSSWRPDDVLAMIGLGALLVALWPLYVALRGTQPLQAPVVIAHVAGMLAGYGVVVLVGLMSRTPPLERGVGADRLARWHSRGGRIAVTLMLVHAWAALIAWADSRHEGLLTAGWHVLRLPWLISATLGTLLFLVIAALSVRSARRRLAHETWHTVHLLAYVAVSLGFVHQLAGPDLAGHRPLQILWALLYTSVFALVGQHRVLTPLRNATRHRMRVQAVVEENAGVVSVIIEGTALHELEPQSGQFFRWRFLTPDLWKTAHPFSLSAAPTSTRLRLTVKSLGDGSTRLQRLEPGTWVVAEGPYGAVTAQRRSCRNVLLVAAGVGITPMRALFESILTAADQDVLLLYRARSEADIIFKDELDRLATRPGARVQYLLGDQVGPVSPELFRWFAPDVVERDVYLCGPAGFARAVRESLRTLRHPEHLLHEERFDF